MDPIDDVFGSMRVHTSLYARIEGSAPWGVTFVRGAAARFGYVVRGEAWLTVEGREPVRVSAGDCWTIVGGARYSLQDELKTPTEYCYKALRAHSNHVVQLGGGGEPVTVVTGWFLFDRQGARPLIDLMPELILTRMDQERSELMEATLQLLASETERQRLGTGIVVSRLADILFIQAIRAHAASCAAEAAGWIGALVDPRLSRAFKAVHARVEHPWTVEELAREAGMSRSAFAARFRDSVGLSPLDYVTRWRMFRAGAMLRQGERSIAEIAIKVGYENESAFAKAFKRVTGITPGAYRRKGGEIGFLTQPVFEHSDPNADGQAVRLAA
ncbi:AraC family transcriptional regulator [Sphingomonas sp.]|jgi:AraC-like DNA-binding protein|uniref:AraC family transcriptional regulator n=1 Tax=Sphingomonas sp. TaxID=28214 RepID=UPI002DEF33DF|nr:AraC family transcriptional regulator [Sphingomonas sp.]